MKTYLLSSVAGVALLAGACGMITTAQAQESALQNWSGFYIGVHIGVGEANVDVFPHGGETSDGIAALSPGGILGGVHIGQNFIEDTFLWGWEADISATDWNDTEAHPGNSDRVSSADINFLASLRARLGVPMGDSLVFVTGGLAYADASYLSDSSAPGGTITGADFDTFGGVVGGGIEWMGEDDWAFRLEGLYYFLDQTELGGGTSTPDGRGTLDDAYVVRIGVTKYFSDARLKRDVKFIKHLPNGLALYRYRYLWSDEEFVGVIAQEVKEQMPIAVTRGSDGYLRVDYALLGVMPITWEAYQASTGRELAIAA